MSIDLPPFFLHVDSFKYNNIPDLMADALMYGYSRFVTRRLLNQGDENLEDSVKKATELRCEHASLRTVFFLWKHGSGLIDNLGVVVAKRQREYPAVFRRDSSWIEHYGTIFSTHSGSWFFLSPANHDGTTQSALTTWYEGSSIDLLMTEVNSREVETGYRNQLFPSGVDIQHILGDKLFYPEEDRNVDLNSTAVVDDPYRFLTHSRPEYIALDFQQKNMLNTSETRNSCSVLRVPYFVKYNDPYTSVFVGTSCYSTEQNLLIPK